MKSKTHENWIFFSITYKAEKMKENKFDTEDVFFFFVAHSWFLYFVKRRVSNARFTLFTNTKPVYYYNVVRDTNEQSGWFSFFSTLICLRFNTIQLIAIILYTLNTCPRKVNEKCQKTFTKINEIQQNFLWIFSIFFFVFFLSLSVAFSLCLLDAERLSEKMEIKRMK